MFKSPILLFNSLGRQLKEFKPLSPKQVRMYSCGPTVYNFAHIGNLRAYLFTDTLRRVLEWKGYDVLHVMNITDVGHLTSDADEGEDKMELSASKQGKTVWEIAQFYTDKFQDDLKNLNILSPSVWCRATDHIQEMIHFAQVCEKNGYTYALEDGLYFDIKKLPEYGKIALLDLEGQEAGARIGLKESKRNPADFAIWRFSPKDQKRLMEWHSPWGVGAPGWHLECSVMSVKYLGERFDIHTGGIDHRQVHHCNEIAQNQAYLGNNNPGADWWIHNEFLVIGGAEKMAKSSGNFLRLQSIIDAGIHPLAYRYFCLQASYRTPLEFTMDALMSARTGLSRLLKRIEALKQSAENADVMPLSEEIQFSRGGSMHYLISELSKDLSDTDAKWLLDFDKAVSNDLNTPQALALLNELVGQDMKAQTVLKIIAVYDLVLGLNLLKLKADDLILRPAEATIDESRIEQLLKERQEARQQKDFKRADEIRKELTSAGVAILDTAAGTKWEWLPKE